LFNEVIYIAETFSDRSKFAKGKLIMNTISSEEHFIAWHDIEAKCVKPRIVLPPKSAI